MNETDIGMDRLKFSAKSEALYDYDTGKRYTYGDLDDRSDALSLFLTETLGLKKGDRVGLCATNNVAFYDFFYATYKTGIIITTYNCLLREKELYSLIENESPKVIFYSREFSYTVENLKNVGFKQEFICIDEKGENDRYSYSEIVERKVERAPDAPELDNEDIQMLIHTGGTTGQPKAAKISFRSIFYNMLADQNVFQLTEYDSAILTLPLFHTAGWNVLNIPLLFAGGKIILIRGFDPGKVLKIIEEEKPTVGISVETMYKAMAMHPQFANTDFGCYRFLITGAAPTSKELLEIYWAKGVKILNAYGMTEIGPNNVCPPLGSMSIEQVREKWNSCGVPAPYNQMRIVDDNGNDVPQGVRGEFIFKGKLLFSGYWNNPEATEEIFTDGWVHTGDMGYIDKDDFCYISGRKKNMYISGGENIFPQEIEDVVMTIPGIIEACIIGVPDAKWGEVGRLLVVMAPGAETTREAIRCIAKQELSSIKIPKYITFVDYVPKNAVGKRDLKEIGRLYGAAKD